jgi:hypothetical protein
MGLRALNYLHELNLKKKREKLLRMGCARAFGWHVRHLLAALKMLITISFEG